jgi:hypothetical protein
VHGREVKEKENEKKNGYNKIPTKNGNRDNVSTR